MTDPGARSPERGVDTVRKPLSGKALVVASSVVVVLTTVVVFVLWWPATKGLTGNELVSARFEALRIGLSIGVGSGGVIVLYLAWRRQRSTEDTLAHQERVAESTEKDATERRITDLYTRAADQLGSDKAPVRLAGLYALERLAQDNPTQRQTIVNVLCAYLRMPFELPGDPPVLPVVESHDTDRDQPDNPAQRAVLGAEIDRVRQQHRELLADHRERIEEQQVRFAAQRLLATHARPGPGGADDPLDTYWPGLELDLTGATLDTVDFSYCHVDTVVLTNARISGDADFSYTRFDNDAWFVGIEFRDGVDFYLAEFRSRALFAGARFGGEAYFVDVTVSDYGGFHMATFSDVVKFDEATLGNLVSFDEAKFSDDAWFGQAKFGVGRFVGAEFGGIAGFGDAVFDYGLFANAKIRGVAGFSDAKFHRGASFARTEFVDDASFEEAEFGGAVETGGAIFANGVPAQLSATPVAGDSSGDPPV